MCDSKQIKVTVYQRYHHIFFLPTFPLGKQLEIRCLACTAAQQDCATPVLIKKHYPQKTNIKYWTGTFIILIAIAAITFSLRNYDSEKVIYLKQPVAGDVYSFTLFVGKEEMTQHMKVINVKGDSIEFIKSEYVPVFYGDKEKYFAANPTLFDGEHTVLAHEQLEKLCKFGSGTTIYRPVK